jgi:hypothetical protein
MSAEHKITGSGPQHDWDCPPCVEANNERKARHAATPNPHRPGTKVYAKFESMRYVGLSGCDPRTETYWSM